LPLTRKHVKETTIANLALVSPPGSLTILPALKRNLETIRVPQAPPQYAQDLSGPSPIALDVSALSLIII
jgi:hypothetical protein